jgi:hypothetical protein
VLFRVVQWIVASILLFRNLITTFADLSILQKDTSLIVVARLTDKRYDSR